ncbi:TraI domain-containing protein [Klebsiella quasipneumoniae]|uniref:TraI domain-containing protein n=1 Tax=Klebsiella quasipneumoniae TaxID=1463165 RepID=UPI003BA24521
MSIISRLFYKIRVALSGGHDYDSIYDTDDEYDIPHTPNKDVQSYLDYPSKPTGITLFSEREILSVHANRLQEINMYIGLPNSDLSEDAYTLTNLVIKPLMEFTRWIHLLPASENHHHAGTGGLLTHSLETAFLALKFAYSTELRPIGLQDEEQIRKRRYLYAAFICGLFHDAGKIFDVDVISSTPGVNSTWRPLSSSLMDWANANRILSYEVIWRKRLANEHSVRAPVFLERCLNDTCLNYLSDVVKERLYDKMLAALGNYTTSDDFISRCMKTADWHSTGTDTSYRYDKQSGIRASDTAARAVAILKDNISILNINGFDSSSERFDKNSPPPVHIMIIGGSVYINEHAALDFILGQFKHLRINFPDGEIGRKALTDLLLTGGYIEPYGEQRIAHFFHRGDFSETDIQRMFDEGIKGLSWFSLLKIKWVGFLFKYDILPESTPGIFSINDTNDYVFVDRKGHDTLYARPLSHGSKSIRLGVNQSSDNAPVLNADKHPVEDSNSAVLDSDNTADVEETEATADENQPKQEPESTQETALNSDEPECKTNESDTRKTAKKRRKKEEISPGEYISRLQHQFNNNAINANDLVLIDGVLYVSEHHIRSIAPLDEPRLMGSGLFVLSLRSGSLDEEFSIPCNDGKRYVQLIDEVSLVQLRHQPDIKEVEMLPLLSADLFGGVKSENEMLSFSFPPPLVMVNPEPLPPERYEEEAPELDHAEHEPNGIPPTEYPDVQEEDVEQYWDDYSSYSHGDNFGYSESGAINQTRDNIDVDVDVDVDVTQDKKLLSESTPDNFASDTEQSPEDVEADSDEGIRDINSDFEALFARQSQIVTDPAVVIAHDLEQSKSLTPSVPEQADISNSETLLSDIDTIINLLNRVKNNNNSAHIRALQRVVLVTDINFCLRFRILDDAVSWGLSQDEIRQLNLALANFPVAALKITIGQAIRHYMIRLDDLQQGALRNNIFYEEFISFFNHQDISNET